MFRDKNINYYLLSTYHVLRMGLCPLRRLSLIYDKYVE